MGSGDKEWNSQGVAATKKQIHQQAKMSPSSWNWLQNTENSCITFSPLQLFFIHTRPSAVFLKPSLTILHASGGSQVLCFEGFFQFFSPAHNYIPPRSWCLVSKKHSWCLGWFAAPEGELKLTFRYSRISLSWFQKLCIYYPKYSFCSPSHLLCLLGLLRQTQCFVRCMQFMKPKKDLQNWICSVLSRNFQPLLALRLLTVVVSSSSKSITTNVLRQQYSLPVSFSMYS